MNVKKLNIFPVLMLVLFSGCLNEDFNPEEWALNPELDFSKSIVIFNSVYSTDAVQIITNYNRFDAVSDADWCHASIDEDKSEIIISVEPNLNSYQRSSEITITISRGNKTLSKVISVVQMGGIWESIGEFNVYWGYSVSESQKDAIKELLSDMIYVDGGSYVMGNSTALFDVTHPHNVTLTSFFIGKFEITQKQWRAIMADNPSPSKGEKIPVYNISWNGALEFCTRLSTLTGLNVALPTEAQWEFAAKGGNKSKGYNYSGSDDLNLIAYHNNTDYTIEPTYVGTLNCNELGIYDMSGNVAEYCSDWYELDYEDPNATNPTGPATGNFKCVRGGHVNSPYASDLRNTSRFNWSKSVKNVTPFTGFRITIAAQ